MEQLPGGGLTITVIQGQSGLLSTPILGSMIQCRMIFINSKSVFFLLHTNITVFFSRIYMIVNYSIFFLKISPVLDISISPSTLFSAMGNGIKSSGVVQKSHKEWLTQRA